MKKSSTPAAETAVTALAGFSPKSPELEFPDWSDSDRTPRPASVEQVHRHSEELLRRAPKPRKHDLARQPVGAEFVL